MQYCYGGGIVLRFRLCVSAVRLPVPSHVQHLSIMHALYHAAICQVAGLSEVLAGCMYVEVMLLQLMQASTLD